MIGKILLLLTLSILALSQPLPLQKCEQLSFLPMPKKIQCDIQNTQKHKLTDPCRILYIMAGDYQAQDYKHFYELIEHQQKKTFHCHSSYLIHQKSQLLTRGFMYNVTIQVKNIELKSVFTTKQQAYSIKIQKQRALINAQTYVGFVRALQTLMQSVTCDKYKVRNCFMSYLPIQINDQPAFSYRSVMVDTARHYQPIQLLYETIDALMYNKMSVMHWHIVDQDSFPLKLDGHPQIAQYAAFSQHEVYTTSQIKDLVYYALIRGVRIIPQLDTPGHAASWGKAPQNKNTACTFSPGAYMGPLDVTLDQTYKLVKQVFAQIFLLFPDPIVHLGGDQVSLTCLTNKTQFVRAQNIKQNQIQITYRRKQKKILRQLNSTKRFMYWMNAEVRLDEDDIIHWWGGGMPQDDRQIVISQYGPFYIDMGVGNYYAVSYGSYSTWLDLYNLNINSIAATYRRKDKVLGAEVTLWSQLSNQYTHHLKIWIRSSSLAQRTWTIANHPAKPDFFRRITAHQRLMNRRGIPTAPATCQQCQYSPQFC